jgi:hypothetical protein
MEEGSGKSFWRAEQLLYSKDAKVANIGTHPLGNLGAQIGNLGALSGNLENFIVQGTRTDCHTAGEWKKNTR